MSTTPRRTASSRGATPRGARRIEGGRSPRSKAGERTLRPATLGWVSPLSALKLSFLTGVALGLAAIGLVTILWVALNTLGVFEDVNSLVGEFAGSSTEEEGASSFTDMMGLGTVLTFTTVFAVINTVVVALLGLLLALIYNLMSSLVGGLQVDLYED